MGKETLLPIVSVNMVSFLRNFVKGNRSLSCGSRILFSLLIVVNKNKGSQRLLISHGSLSVFGGLEHASSSVPPCFEYDVGMFESLIPVRILHRLR